MSTEHEGRIKIGISIGDIHGIGPEVVIKALSDNRITQVCTPVIYGNSKVISHYRKTLSLQEFNFNTIRSIQDIIPRKVNLINCWEEEVKIEMGVASTVNGVYAMKSLEAATNDLKSGFIDALVTAPIDKHSIAPGTGFTGHTEYLAKAFNTSDYLMFLVDGDLRVALVTGHVPISQIAPMITKERILKKLKVMIQSLKRDFGIRKPKIAVLGLNPHAGDSGVIGNEDREIIAPTIKEAFASGLLVFGPYPSDGFFGAGQHLKFDAILAMYHDQGLIPFKTLAFESGVNYTAGLPVVRTSPDHGVAYDIAGKGIASETSIREAIYTAVDIVNRRVDYDEVNEKPLAFGKLTGER
ncbi:MAG: 4-hydroxythreonine-4-phosphate dehydrogenase PdxA [Bacteroidia bacterium]|jgi:4-hydroxythreonine-4-phosphate dehydrogenase|nr:4-hydroxythreonine-4-phosphate dehydrogenase PdxA [Bacteroidota bacterium]MBP6512642.1 4-hydroxythreonine-4-phosphate dehydrogenase PdxA [Bacteroidia bacterium]MBP7243842.1 4-hydroxythreonine-4-phosphate dehydrogenase PdxA [Bacteroidia bacterium]